MLNGNRRIASYVLAGILLLYCFEHFFLLKEITSQQYTLHTITEIKVLCRNERQGRRAVLAAFARLKELEEKFNYFSPASELSRLNKEAHAREMPLSDDMFGILTLALEGSALSDGAFDITATPITRLYGFGTDIRRAPDSARLQTAQKQVGWQNIRLDPQKQTIRLLNKNTLLDLGGIAKGYAVDEAVEVLRRHGIKQGLVNSGGNIYALGRNRGKPWRIGIRNPRADTPAALSARETALQTLELSDAACATSGDYEQYFMDGNKRYAHIFNPRTGQPANQENNLASVTVIAATAARADLLSTACFVMGEEKSASLPEKKFFYYAEE
ncbi:MAG: FAD:protein FMN transferase [Candidatus Margulisbacteria bacterium]|jgi:thiamine biosynthesis lipoprotein|nr:FAD:protein FMN transferase [Candidatus Margulisiibacteriota bacterium]